MSKFIAAVATTVLLVAIAGMFLVNTPVGNEVFHALQAACQSSGC